MFENASALYLSLIMVPVILLYLLRPKPRPIKIPSLMLLSSERKKKLKSLFDKLIKDPLLLLQLLAIMIIVLDVKFLFRDIPRDRFPCGIIFAHEKELNFLATPLRCRILFTNYLDWPG